MIIAVTMGDPYGIGPEVVLKSLSDNEIRSLAGYLILGSKEALDWTAARLEMDWQPRIVSRAQEAPEGQVSLLDDLEFEWDEQNVGKPTAQGGGAAAHWIMLAAEFSLSDDCAAMVTAPISKEALWKSGHRFQGHTEFLAHLTNSPRVVMMLVGGGLRVALVTTHTPLKAVPSLITMPDVLYTIQLTNESLKGLWGITHPRIAVCGLNPHAGEGGLFGEEEAREIAPAIKEARKHRIDCTGPYPADTIFHRVHKGEFDAVVAMYHDQGLVALKLIAFETGVNVTLGLPIIRTSPDHGTAYDIAGKSLADPSSMKEAIKLAASLARRKSAASGGC